MEEREIAIRLSGVKKMYKLGQIGGGTLTADLQSWWARIRGKEDPNTMIGSDQRLTGRTFMALNGIDLTVYKGEALGIIGSNGAGKSTMLKLLSRVTAPTEGEIGINGRIASMLEVGTGFNPEMTGRENVYLNGAILGMTKAEIDAKMEDIIEFSEVREFIDTPVKRYSSGMYVKLAFAVAAHLDAEIMIMDEVLAVGDMKFQQKCLGRMGDAAGNEGRTVLYVSHNMNTIRQLCTRCIVLDQGRIIFDGDVEQAIGIYMNQSEDCRLTYDYSNVKRSVNESRKLQLLGAEIQHKSENCFYMGESIHFMMRCKANEDTENMGLRLELFFADNTVAGTAFSDRMIHAKKDQIVELNMVLDTKNIAPGRYRAVALIYEKNEFGTQVGVDRVDPALSFEIINSKSDNLTWLHQYWGHTRFDNIVIEQIAYK